MSDKEEILDGPTYRHPPAVYPHEAFARLRKAIGFLEDDDPDIRHELVVLDELAAEMESFGEHVLPRRSLQRVRDARAIVDDDQDQAHALLIDIEEDWKAYWRDRADAP